MFKGRIILRQAVWADREELEAESKVFNYARFKAEEREFGLLFLFVENHLPRGPALEDTPRVTAGQLGPKRRHDNKILLMLTYLLWLMMLWCGQYSVYIFISPYQITSDISHKPSMLAGFMSQLNTKDKSMRELRVVRTDMDKPCKSFSQKKYSLQCTV